MKQEEKELLIKDLSARLPYSVKAQYFDAETWQYETSTINGIDLTAGPDIIIFQYCLPVEAVKPYLRPMSSMTEEEKEYIKNRWCCEDWDSMYDFLNYHQIDAGDADSFTDWLNANHFDYRGLIEKKLALDCTGLHIYD